MSLAVGDGEGSVPAGLIDHNLLSGGAQLDAIEVVYGDGSSVYYSPPAAGSLTYVPTNVEGAVVTDGSVLSKNPGGGSSASNPRWTLTDASGLGASFGEPDSSTGRSDVLSAQLQAERSNPPRLTYTYGSSQYPRLVTRVSDSSGRSLDLVWSDIDPGGCSAAILCVTAPDGQTWRYIGDEAGGTGGKLVRVHNGTRDVMKVDWTGSRITAIYNANDLDPGNASPGYNPAHRTEIAYKSCTSTGCFDGAVQSVTDKSVSSDGSTVDVGYGFAYGGQTTFKPHATLAAHGSTAAGTVRTAGYLTRIHTPRQGGPGTSVGVAIKVWSDPAGRLLEYAGQLHGQRGFLYQYNAQGKLLWTEDPAGNPTDNSYDPATEALVSMQGPDPDGSGPKPRPTTSHRYDERQVGTASTPGMPLLGLRTAYYENANLGGLPVSVRTEPASQEGAVVDNDWSSSGPGPLDGRTSDFSVRWSGRLPSLAAGNYEFSVSADDGVRLLVDDRPVIEEWADSGTRTLTGSTTLTEGSHRITLEYSQRSGPSEIHLSWKPPGESTRLLVASDARPAYANQTGTVSPEGEISFSHFADPVSGRPDYTLEGGDLPLVTSFDYDALGRITRKAMPKANTGRTISDDGDLQGTPDSHYITDYDYYTSAETAAPPAACPSGPAVNQGDQLKAVRPHGVATSTTVYDLMGRPLAKTNGKGTSCSSYDAEGRLASERTPSDPQVSSCADSQASACYSYDPAGQRRTSKSAAGTITLRYDEVGRLVGSEQTAGSTTLAEAALVYDGDSNVILEKVAAGPLASSPVYTTRMTYDIANKISGVKDPPRVANGGGGFTATYGYDVRNNLKYQQLGDQALFTYFDYDSAGQTSAVYNRHGTICYTCVPTTVPADANPVVDYAYQHDLDGRVTSETRSGGGLPTEAQSYQYDAAGRLSTVGLPDGTQRQYSYDADSNRTRVTDTPQAGLPETRQELSYDPATTPGIDQLTQLAEGGTTTNYRYTDDGQVSTRGSDSISWDGRGRQTGGTFNGTDVDYTYDAVGRLQQRTTSNPGSTTRYLYLGTDEAPRMETNANGEITKFYVSGPLGTLEVFDRPPPAFPSGPRTYQFLNGHGDLAATADASGARTAAYTYGPFGEPNESTAANTLVDRYVGRWQKKLDTASGLVLMGARPYEADTGRFLAVDPVDGGSANNYDYANQDPVNQFDLDGRQAGCRILSVDIHIVRNRRGNLFVHAQPTIRCSDNTSWKVTIDVRRHRAGWVDPRVEPPLQEQGQGSRTFEHSVDCRRGGRYHYDLTVNIHGPDGPRGGDGGITLHARSRSITCRWGRRR